jgi:hypothetical protein
MAGLFVTATPASATASDGITIGQFAYVFETNDWLDVTLAGCPSPAPTFVVLNIGNGQTDDVAHLESVAQTIMGCGIKVYGYVDAAPARSLYDIALDSSRWINPFNPERTIGGRMVDGIFLDQYPRDCGPIETPVNNTANDSDYVLRGDSMTASIDSQFSTWSYPTPTIMANVGTAVRGCHPGWTGLSGHDMPDKWVTAENDWSTYQAGWAGGNLLTGGTFGTTYVEGNSYYPDAFVHIVHGASTMADTEAAIDLADARGAASVFVTDDVMSNPYDTIPTYLQGSLTYASTGPMGYRMDYGNDFVHGSFSGTNYIGVLQETYDPGCVGGGFTRCQYPTDGLTNIYNAVTANCAGSWGTAGHTLGESGGIYDADRLRSGVGRGRHRPRRHRVRVRHGQPHPRVERRGRDERRGRLPGPGRVRHVQRRGGCHRLRYDRVPLRVLQHRHPGEGSPGVRPRAAQRHAHGFGLPRQPRQLCDRPLGRGDTVAVPHLPVI